MSSRSSLALYPVVKELFDAASIACRHCGCVNKEIAFSLINSYTTTTREWAPLYHECCMVTKRVRYELCFSFPSTRVNTILQIVRNFPSSFGAFYNQLYLSNSDATRCSIIKRLHFCGIKVWRFFTIIIEQ